MNLIKLHYKFMQSKKVYIITLSLVTIVFLILLIQSNILSNFDDFDIRRNLYIDDYLYNGINLLKIVVVVFSMLTVIYSLLINKYDIFLVSRYSRKFIIITKTLVMLLINITLSVILTMLYLVFWLLIDSNVTVDIMFQVLIHFTLFSIYYTIIFSLLILFFENLFISFIPFIGYIVSNLSIDYGIDMDKINSTSRFLNIVFPDILIINRHFYYVYGVVFVLATVCFMFLLLISRYLYKDLII